MAVQTDRVILTYQEYLELPNDRNRYEILEGELEVNPAPNVAHQRAVVNLSYLLVAHTRAHRLGQVLVAPTDVILSDITVVQPDLLFISSERASIVLPQHVRGAPDLVVEVISPTSEKTDRDVKRQLYARYGVRCYWLVDPAARTLTAFMLDGDRYRPVASASGDQEFRAAPFEDLAIPLADVWD